MACPNIQSTDLMDQMLEKGRAIRNWWRLLLRRCF